VASRARGGSAGCGARRRRATGCLVVGVAFVEHVLVRQWLAGVGAQPGEGSVWPRCERDGDRRRLPLPLMLGGGGCRSSSRPVWRSMILRAPRSDAWSARTASATSRPGAKKICTSGTDRGSTPRASTTASASRTARTASRIRSTSDRNVSTPPALIAVAITPARPSLMALDTDPY
jgi:hypothetical protein